MRIRCRPPEAKPQTTIGPFGMMINGLVASWCDVEVTFIADDGTEMPWLGVRSVEFKAVEGTDAITAKIEVYNPEIDVVVDAEGP